MDAARHTDQRQSISRNFSLKNPTKKLPKLKDCHIFIFIIVLEYSLISRREKGKVIFFTYFFRKKLALVINMHTGSALLRMSGAIHP